MQVVVNDLLANYSITGKGKKILLLHGWGDNSKGLIGLANQLSQTYEVIALDLPGFGATQPPKEVWGLDEYAAFVASFLKKIDTDKLFAIVAHSNGGAIAIKGVGKGVLSPTKLVLLASSGIRGEYKGRIKAIRLVTKAGKALTMPLPKSAKKRIRKVVYKTVGSDMLVAEHLQQTFKKVVTDDVRNDAKNIDIPTLLIYGENDTAAPPNYGRIFHEQMSNSTLEIVNGVGHFLHLDKPTQVGKLVEEFLK